jgi:hypothetical protein
MQAGRDLDIDHCLLGWKINGWFIINYDILRNHPELKSSGPWDLVILDESNKLKNPEAIRTRHVFGSDTIAPIPAEKALLLTGTPMINYVQDLYTQLHFLDPALWPSFEQFVEDQYFPGYTIITPSQIVGDERNLERLSAAIGVRYDSAPQVGVDPAAERERDHRCRCRCQSCCAQSGGAGFTCSPTGSPCAPLAGALFLGPGPLLVRDFPPRPQCRMPISRLRSQNCTPNSNTIRIDR